MSDQARQAVILRRILIAEAAIVAAGGLLITGMCAIGSLTAEVAIDHVLAGDTSLVDVAQGVALAPDGTVDVVVDDPSLRQRFLAVLADLPTVLVVLAMLTFATQAVSRLLRSGPFPRELRAHLRRLGMVAAVAGPAAWLVEFAARLVLADSVSTAGFGADLALLPAGAWLLVASMCFALAELVDQGHAMQDELGGVI
jgi:hypothetical protein